MRIFEDLIKDLDKRKGMRIVFDIDKFKRILSNPPTPVRLLNFPVILYLSFNVPFNNGNIPPPEQIARDLKMNIETVKEEIANLKNFGFLE